MLNLNRNKILKKLANLQFAIGLLLTIGLIIALGTVIEQDQSLTFYKENYSEVNPLFGFLTWRVITFLSLDKLYTAWWFLILLFLFGSSLLACTFTTQLPSIKTFKLWKFMSKPPQYKRLGVDDTIKSGFSNTVAYNCNDNRYHFFRQRTKGYGYSGLLGRLAPIVVHGSIIILLLGSTLGSFGGYIAQEIIPVGEIFHIQNLTKFGNISYVPQDLSCRINNFWITYTKELKTDQFYSDLSLLNEQGKEIKRKIVFVNEPLIYKDIVLYQTDWDIVGLKLKFDNKKIFQVPLKRINKGGNRFWFGSLNLNGNAGNNLTIVINDLKGKIFLYDSNGVLLQELLIGESIKTTEGVKIKVVDFITSTGLQIKSDPGINVVYFSFLLLMVSIYVSFFTYSQIWFVEVKKNIVVGGKSNRAVLFFQQEFKKIIKRSTNLPT
jgi:cytochrome c biogenesis protein|tara:strand:- start:15701 stop:17008 length:1308 start_codon:yes stop_codon:yes gene_type:complete